MNTAEKNLYRIVVTIVVLVICGNCAQKHPTKQELQQSLTLRAEQGDVQAQFELGKFYYFLEENPARHEKAYPWFVKAAEKGNAYAMHYLGRMYHYGYFVQKDERKAKDYFSKSIATIQNDSLTKNPEAWYCMGWSFHYGIEVEKNDTEAVKCFEKAAKKGNIIAQYDLGLCYIKGEGAEKDQKQAEKWMRKAAECNDAMAQYLFAFKSIWFSTDDLENFKILYNQLNADSKNIVKWLTLSSHQGLSYAEYSLGNLYDVQSAFCLSSNEQRALELKTSAAQKGYFIAQYDIGKYYIFKWYGNNQNQSNYDKAIFWFEKAAASGSVPAQYEMFSHYALRDLDKALYWLELAANQGDKDSQSMLGTYYLLGKGVKKNYVIAYKWLILGLRFGDDETIPMIDDTMSAEDIAKGEKLVKTWTPKINTNNNFIIQPYNVINVTLLELR